MRPNLLNIGLSSIGLGIIVSEFAKSGLWDIYVSDFEKKDSEISTPFNRSLKSKRHFFVRDTKFRIETLCDITDFFSLEDRQGFYSKFSTLPDLVLCLNFDRNEFDNYFPIIDELLVLRKRLHKRTVLISTQEYQHFSDGGYKDYIEILSEKRGTPYLKSVFDIFVYKTRMVDDELTVVVESVSGRWHICKSDFDTYPVDFYQLMFNVLQTKVTGRVSFDKHKLCKFLNSLVTEVLGFFCQYNNDVFLSEYLSKHEGKKTFRRIVTAIIAIYNVRDKDIFSEFKILEDRLLLNEIDCIKVAPWLVDKVPNLSQQERLKRDLKFKKLKDVDFREIEILFVFFKKLGMLPPL